LNPDGLTSPAAHDEVEPGRVGESPEVAVTREERQAMIDAALRIEASPRRAFLRLARTVARSRPARAQ
jgi:hypothetical protein